MLESSLFYKSVLDSVAEQIVVIDEYGAIQFVNRAWKEFGVPVAQKGPVSDWTHYNYLDVCDGSAKRGERYATGAAEGIRKVIGKEIPSFQFQYPCHRPGEKRWYVMSVTPLDVEGNAFYAISHQNVTKRKLAEDRVLQLSRTDALTKLPNRRYFDEVLASEWKRCSRLELPISLAIMDIDHFKLLNDRYGHPAGDECLVKVGEMLNRSGRRPGDIFARYGGEEFALVFTGTSQSQALVPMRKMVEEIGQMQIPNESAPTKPIVTVSIGLATMFPDATNDVQDLIAAADELLYSAKYAGRDRIVTGGSSLATVPSASR